MPATPKAKAVLDAIKARLLAMVGASYNYAPEKVDIRPYTMDCFQTGLKTAYVIEVDQDEHEEGFTNAENELLMRLTIIGIRRLKTKELPFRPDTVHPSRADEQNYMEQDLMNRFFGTSADITLDGSISNIASVPVIVEKGEETYVDGFAVIFARFVPQVIYVRGEA